jgi:beta-fructofuranosidase
MPLVLPDRWLWDFWLAQDGADWHVFFLQAPRSLGDPELRHRNATVGHAVSRDLRHWRELPTAFAPSEGPAFDDWTTWTGSVVRNANGGWHLFYTGTTHADDGFYQRIGHAVSDDLSAWTRVGSGPCLDLNGSEYEEYLPSVWHDRAFRDPFVIRDPDGDGWFMYFTARVPGRAEPNAGGAIGFATSPDLRNWTLRPPVFAGHLFGQMEVPQVFSVGSRWYMLFSTSAFHWSSRYRELNPEAPVSGTHYLIADHPRGPWTVAPGPFFDGAMPNRRYSGKIVETAEGLVYLAFVDPALPDALAGCLTDPIPVAVGPEGDLRWRT